MRYIVWRDDESVCCMSIVTFNRLADTYRLDAVWLYLVDAPTMESATRRAKALARMAYSERVKAKDGR